MVHVAFCSLDMAQCFTFCAYCAEPGIEARQSSRNYAKVNVVEQRIVNNLPGKATCCG